MQSNEELEKALARIGYTPNTGKIAIRTLANTLSTNERVLEVLEGGSESTVGLLVATDLRLLYVGCSPLRDSVIRIIRYNDISCIKYRETDFPSSEIEIQKPVETIKIVGCAINQTKTFIDLVKSMSEERKSRAMDLDELY